VNMMITSSQALVSVGWYWLVTWKTSWRQSLNGWKIRTYCQWIEKRAMFILQEIYTASRSYHKWYQLSQRVWSMCLRKLNFKVIEIKNHKIGKNILINRLAIKFC
jgi:hypothetical protein